MSQNTHVTVRLTPELRLKRVLTEENPETVTKLTVEGMLTIDDFEYIRNFMYNLQVLYMDSMEENKYNHFYKLGGLTLIIPASITDVSKDAYAFYTNLQLVQLVKWVQTLYLDGGFLTREIILKKTF